MNKLTPIIQPLAFILFFILFQSVPANTQVLRGIVKGDNGAIIPNANVFILGVGEDVTDSKGAFSIALTNCNFCKIGSTVKINVNSSYGAVEQAYTIPSNLDRALCQIVVPQNNQLIVTGKVRDQATKRFIPGIKVTAVINGVNVRIPSVISDSRGIFRIIISQSAIGFNQAIELTFIDDTHNKYQDTEQIVYTNQRAPLTIELEERKNPGTVDSLTIGGPNVSSIQVKAGDLVSIEASGVVKFGAIVGTAGPGGFPNNKGAFGISLSGYNLFPNWNHGALLFRFGNNDRWKYYDLNKQNTYMVQHNGLLEFNLNDNKQGDNSGAFDVKVTIKK